MICVPVMAETNREAMAGMKKAFALADLVELRVDRIRGPDLSLLVGPREGALLITNRRKEEGGFFAGPEKDRVDLLIEAAGRGADYVDVEASTPEPFLSRLASEMRRKGRTARMILSHHDFRGTPSFATLTRRFRACRALGGYAVKIVTFARTAEDNLRLLRLIPLARSEGQPIIAFCMGPRGKVSRILAPLLGSLWTYACLRKGAESAPGQWTVGETRKILGLLGWKEPRFREIPPRGEGVRKHRAPRRAGSPSGTAKGPGEAGVRP